MDPFKPALDEGRKEDSIITSSAAKVQMELDAAIAFLLQTDEEEGLFQQSIHLSMSGSHSADSEQRPKAENTLHGEDILDKTDGYEGVFLAGQNQPDGSASGTGSSTTDLVASDQTITDSKDQSLQADSDDDDYDDNDKKPAAKTEKDESITTAMDMDVALALSLQQQEHANLAFGVADDTFGHSNIADPNVARAPTAVDQTDDSPEINSNLASKGCTQSGEACWDLDEQLAISQLREEHERAMNSTFSGRAWAFVETVVEEHKKLTKSIGEAVTLTTVAVDDMLAMVERFAEAHAVFKYDGKDTHVDIGYHFTSSGNVHQISTCGLLTKGERQAKGVENNYNGSIWGDGVYTGNNPHAFSYYGDIGLLVARLRGYSIPATRSRSLKGDTAIANEGFSNEMVILGQSYQCVPLLQFRQVDATGNADGIIWTFHCKLQEIVDTFFNNGTKTRLNPSQPPENWSASRTARPYVSRAQHPVAGWSSDRAWQQRASKYQLWTSEQTFELPKPMNSSPCKSETFCRFEEKSCNQGEMMRILFYSKDKLACEKTGTFIIIFGFRRYEGLIHRIEYLPDIPPSRDIIERLKYAFQCGAVHKTSFGSIRRKSPYEAYPDHASKYMRALDRLGIPQADECRNRSSKKRPEKPIVDDVSLKK